MSLEPDQLDQSPIAHEVLDGVRTILAEVIGEDYLAEIQIGPETSFYTDLEIESIELVALAEGLEAKYGDQIDFAAWIASMDIDEIIAMTVGRLVEFIVSAISVTELT